MSKRYSLIEILPFLVWACTVLAACTFDGADLDERRCSSNADCSRFGSGLRCDDGYCQNTGVALCGSNADCDDGLFCTGEFICAPESPSADQRGCVQSDMPELDDGIACTVDTCNEDTDEVEHDGTTCPCQTDLDCRDAPGGGPCFAARCIDFACEFETLPVGSACNDGFGCTADTQCNSNGECAGRLNDQVCDDALFCNGSERCAPTEPGADADGCVAGEVPVAPDDGIDCTISTCDEVTDQVSQEPSETCECTSPGEPCEDDTPADCTVLRCSDDLVCVVEPRAQGSPCDDGFACTDGDTCDSAATCVGMPNDDGCDDGLFCNGTGICDPTFAGADSAGCLPGSPPVIDDGVACTVDSCSEITQRAEHDGSSCGCSIDDDCTPSSPDPCWTYRCSSGVCLVEPATEGTSCDDGSSCTLTDECDGRGVCRGDPSVAACSDEIFCNGVEVCQPNHPNADLEGCRASPAPAIDDLVACTVDACEECAGRPDCEQGLQGEITHTPMGCLCASDGDCAGSFPDRPCVVGRCNPLTFSCVPEVLEPGTPCDDGVECTTGTMCDSAGECSGGIAEDCDCNDDADCIGEFSNLPCFDGVCDLGSFNCTPVAREVGASCDDGLACTNDDTCNASFECVGVQTAACDCTDDEDCETPCTVSAMCVSGACVTENLSDGTDCSLACADASPAGSCRQGECLVDPEGPTGDATCSDGLDNDCDGVSDGSDDDCLVPTAVVLAGPATAPAGLSAAGATVDLVVSRDARLGHNQSENLYCTARKLVSERVFTDPTLAAITADADISTNGGADAENNITANVPFDGVGSPSGLQICNGYGLEIIQDTSDVDRRLGFSIEAGVFDGSPSLGPRDVLLVSYSPGNNGSYYSTLVLTEADVGRLATFEFAISNRPSSIALRVDVLNLDGDYSNNPCAFLRSVRFFDRRASPSANRIDLTWDTQPPRTARELFEGTNIDLFLDLFELDPTHNHIVTVVSNANTAGSPPRGAAWRPTVAGDTSTGVATYAEFPAITTIPVDYDRSAPQYLFFNARVNNGSFVDDDPLQVRYSLDDGTSWRTLTSEVGTDDAPSFIADHYTSSNVRVAVFPEEAKPLLGVRTRFEIGALESDERLFLDNITHTLLPNPDFAISQTTSPALAPTTHNVTINTINDRDVFLQCFWQVPGDVAFPTVASNPLVISFQ